MINRIALARHFAKLGFTKGAEIGVYEGYFSKVLLDTIPNLELLCVDSWHKRQYMPAYEIAKETLSGYNATIVKKFSVDAAKDVPDESLDFVYIDGDHKYESVKEDIEAWAPKVREGGIVSGDDYYKFKKSGNTGVIDAVDEYVKEHGYDLQLTEVNNRGTHRDNFQPSWWFVKESNDNR